MHTNYKTIFKNVEFITIVSISCIFVFYSMGKLMLFLSFPSKQIVNTNDSVTWSLLINTCLVSVFIVQHSLLILPIKVRNFLQQMGFDVLNRSFFNFFSAVLLLLLLNNWRQIPIIIWQLDNSSTTWMAFAIVHLFAWSVLYTGCILMDMGELLGIKQVYYNIRNLPQPLSLKSEQLQRLYTHCRHPSISAFAILLLVTPVLSLDRLLLSILMIIYMYVSCTTDQHDVKYVQQMRIRKIFT